MSHHRCCCVSGTITITVKACAATIPGIAVTVKDNTTGTVVGTGTTDGSGVATVTVSVTGTLRANTSSAHYSESGTVFAFSGGSSSVTVSTTPDAVALSCTAGSFTMVPGASSNYVINFAYTTSGARSRATGDCFNCTGTTGTGTAVYLSLLCTSLVAQWPVVTCDDGTDNRRVATPTTSTGSGFTYPDGCGLNSVDLSSQSLAWSYPSFSASVADPGHGYPLPDIGSCTFTLPSP